MQFPHFNEMESLCNAFAEGRCNAEDLRRLEELVISSDAATQYYVRFFSLHYEIMDSHREDEYQRRFEAKLDHLFVDKTIQQSDLSGIGTSEEEISRAVNTSIFPLLDFEKELLDSPTDSIAGGTSSSMRYRSEGGFFGWASLAAYVPLGISLMALALVLGIILVLPIYQSQNTQTGTWNMVARVKRTVDCQWKDGKHAFPAGTFLVSGQELDLEVGLAEIEFSSGAKVILQGPAQFITSDRNASQLCYGRLAAYVPKGAEGFAVKTPWLDVIDRGTEFGLAVGHSTDQSTEVHVFKGLVEVETDSSLPSQTSLTLAANEAIVCNAQTNRITPIPANSNIFVRNLDSIKSVPTDLGTSRLVSKVPTSETIEFQKGVAGYNASKATFIRNCVRGKDASRQGSYAAIEKSEPDNTNSNYGTDALLLTASKTNRDKSLPEQSRALIAFDDIFGSKPDQIPPNATILSATLWLHVTAEKNAESPERHTLHEVSEDWQEGAVTWASFGNGGQASKQYKPKKIAKFTPDVSGKFHKLDVTQSLQRWSQGASNHGWILINHGWDRAHFDSDDAPEVVNRPRLAVEYRLLD